MKIQEAKVTVKNGVQEIIVVEIFSNCIETYS